MINQNNHSNRLLIVEDSKAVVSMLTQKLSINNAYSILATSTYKETKIALENEPNDFFASVLDLNLPDAQEGEIVDFIISKQIPVIVLTASFDNEVRKKILSKNVVDYVVKEGIHSIDHVVHIINRLKKNQEIQVLIVDDSAMFRKMVRHLLELQQLNVIEAEDGIQAIKMLKKELSIRLVITDCEMPNMDGFELISIIRKKYPREILPIIGVSSTINSYISAQFLKLGANDFLHKPFLNEEFNCRVLQNIQLGELIHDLRESAIRDTLTGLHNRKYLFDEGEQIFENVIKSDKTLAVGLLDIDHFKKVNDTYGHDIGDLALKHVADILKRSVRKSDIAVRFGGEEFVILFYNMSEQQSLLMFEKIRSRIEESEFYANSLCLKITISIGVCINIARTLEQTIKKADDALYQAKNNGRNRVITV